MFTILSTVHNSFVQAFPSTRSLSSCPPEQKKNQSQSSSIHSINLLWRQKYRCIKYDGVLIKWRGRENFPCSLHCWRLSVKDDFPRKKPLYICFTADSNAFSNAKHIKSVLNIKRSVINLERRGKFCCFIVCIWFLYNQLLSFPKTSPIWTFIVCCKREDVSIIFSRIWFYFLRSVRSYNSS